LIDGGLRVHVGIIRHCAIGHIYACIVGIGILVGQIIIEHIVIAHIGAQYISAAHIITEHIGVICRGCAIIQGWTEHIVAGSTLSVVVGKYVGKGIRCASLVILLERNTNTRIRQLVIRRLRQGDVRVVGHIGVILVRENVGQAVEWSLKLSLSALD
jgi:hypothetical protein